MVTSPVLGALLGTKTFGDYERANQEFNMKKQNAAMQGQELAIRKQALEAKAALEFQELQEKSQKKKQLSGLMQNFDGKDPTVMAQIAALDPKTAEVLHKIGGGGGGGAFAGTSMDAQTANLAYQEGLNQGLDDFSARKYAIDKIASSKIDLRLNPQTGTLESIARQPIFGGGMASPSVAPSIEPSSGGVTKPSKNTNYAPARGNDVYAQYPNMSPADVDFALDSGINPNELYWQQEEVPIDNQPMQPTAPQSPLGEALLKTSGLKQTAQTYGRSITAPIDQLIQETTGYNANLSGKIGGDGLKRANQFVQQFTERAVRPMMKTKAFGEKQDLIKKYNPASSSIDGAIESLGAIVDTLQIEKQNLEKQMELTENLVEREKIKSTNYIEVLNLLEEGKTALQLMQGGGASTQQPTGGQKIRVFNPQTGRLE
jgi:hypothetical protein